MAKSTRTIVGSPLQPSLLAELEALKPLPPESKDFDPVGSWSHIYRIWTCHGYRESSNDNVGYLAIEKKAGKDAAGFTLTLRQVVLETDAQVSSIDAGIKCLSDTLATPLQWSISSIFTGPDGSRRDQLSTAGTGDIKGPELVVDIDGRRTKQTLPGPVAVDWCLFEAVQRREFSAGPVPPFNLLEGLSLLKGPQDLSYHGPAKATIGGVNVVLHRFDQTGHGVLPVEYWLDSQHRLLLVTSLNKAYILDDSAIKLIDGEIKSARKAYRAKRQG